MNRKGLNCLAIAGMLCAMLGAASPASAQTTVPKHVSWNLDALVGHPAGGFVLSFQLTDGSGLGNGSTSVALTGGGLSPFTLTDNSFYQIANHNLSPASGLPLEFDLAITYTGADEPTPDQFSFAVLDGSGFELPTFGPADASATLDVTSTGIQVATFAGDTSREPNAMGPPIALAAPVITDASPAAVPEPGAAMLFVPVLGLLVIRRRSLKC